MSQQSNSSPRGVLTAIVRLFLTSHLSIILLVAALIVGAAAITVTPREEEPQIVVPMADVYVQMPGASASEVERLVARPLEKLLWQIDGVEFVYSVARRGQAVVTVRFFVGEDRERSIVKLRNRISMNHDLVPPGVMGWVVKPVEIDDVPIVTLTLFSEKMDGYGLRRVGEEVLAQLEDLEDLSRSTVTGGHGRKIRVVPDRRKLAGMGLSLLEIMAALQGADAALDSGAFASGNRWYEVSAGPFVSDLEDLKRLVVGAHQGRPVYLSDVAAVQDGPEEVASYTRIGFGLARAQEAVVADRKLDDAHPAVTLAISKKKGTNAVEVARRLLARVESLKGSVIPDDVKVLVTRNSGKTADLKVDELLESLLFAIVSVVLLITVAMGWREGIVVAAAVPVSFALALFVNWQAGFTINRVTLFALILSLGLVVDDPITNVDNIQRHLRMGKQPPVEAVLTGVSEVLPPVIMSTLAIIVSFTPMFFITGMMGPYMGPMAINVPLTVTFSTVSALTFVPWLAFLLLRGKFGKRSEAGAVDAEADPTPPWIRRVNRAMVAPFLKTRRRSWGLLLFIALLLFASGSLALLRKVPLKMLPFDNKNEMQLVIDLPEGTPLESTDAVVRRFEDFLRTVPEVTDFETFVGVPSPIDFNGMVRHYYFRHAPNLAEIRFNLVTKDRRQQQSHTIGLRLRNELTALARAHDAKLKIVEVPPGPPVLSTVVAEIYGEPGTPYEDLLAASKELQQRMVAEPGVVDVDDMSQSPHARWVFEVDKVKASLLGVDTQTIVQSLHVALNGQMAGLLHVEGERQALEILLRLAEGDRSGVDELLALEVKARTGRNVSLRELGRFVKKSEDQPIYHKNLKRVVFVLAEMAGRAPGEAILDLQSDLEKRPLPQKVRIDWAGEGEWLITLRVFRDLGIAFAVALVGIYILVVVETNSFFMPLIIMSAIPLTAIGIMPGFWLMNMVVAVPVGGYLDVVFFTATGMIGMIALGGIVVRNSIVLIEFIRDSREEGKDLRQAILEAGAVRFRPIMLTAGTTALGAWPITFDPIFSGLAWALIFGLFASTLFTLVVIPVVYNLVYGATDEDGPIRPAPSNS